LTLPHFLGRPVARTEFHIDDGVLRFAKARVLSLMSQPYDRLALSKVPRKTKR
jgi:hypothetical protein